MVTLKIKGPPNQTGFILWRPRMSVQTFLSIHPMIVERIREIVDLLMAPQMESTKEVTIHPQGNMNVCVWTLCSFARVFEEFFHSQRSGLVVVSILHKCLHGGVLKPLIRLFKACSASSITSSQIAFEQCREIIVSLCGNKGLYPLC